MAMSELSLTDSQVEELCAFLYEGLATTSLKRQAIILAHGGVECPSCVAAFDAKWNALANLYNKMMEYKA